MSFVSIVIKQMLSNLTAVITIMIHAPMAVNIVAHGNLSARVGQHHPRYRKNAIKTDICFWNIGFNNFSWSL